MSAVLLGVVSSLGLQLSGSITRTAQQQKKAASQQRWLALQLQRDAGLLIRQGALLAIDCSDSEQRRQGLEQLHSLRRRRHIPEALREGNGPVGLSLKAL